MKCGTESEVKHREKSMNLVKHSLHKGHTLGNKSNYCIAPMS